MSLEYNFLSYPSKSPLDLLQTIKEDFSLNSVKSLIMGTSKKEFPIISGSNIIISRCSFKRRLIMSITAEFLKLSLLSLLRRRYIPITPLLFLIISFAINVFLFELDRDVAFTTIFVDSGRCRSSSLMSFGKQYPPKPKDGLL